MAKAPVVFAHGWVDGTEGSWADGTGYLARRISLAQAKQIAAAGGVVGLWGLGLRSPGPSRKPGHGNWNVGRGDARGYARARELASLVDRLGEDHVAIGSALHGVGPAWSVNDYGHVLRAGAEGGDGEAQKLAGAARPQGAWMIVQLTVPLIETPGCGCRSSNTCASLPSSFSSTLPGPPVRPVVSLLPDM